MAEPALDRSRDGELRSHRTEHGFTLMEILVSIVIVGILAAVALVGIASVTGTSRSSACSASADAARTAAAEYFAETKGTFPTDWSSLTTTSPPLYELAEGMTINAGIPTELDAKGWTLTMHGGGTTEATFTCS